VTLTEIRNRAEVEKEAGNTMTADILERLCNHIAAMNAIVSTSLAHKIIKDGWNASLEFLDLKCE
jgi:hypothetical protein